MTIDGVIVGALDGCGAATGVGLPGADGGARTTPPPPAAADGEGLGVALEDSEGEGDALVEGEGLGLGEADGVADELCVADGLGFTLGEGEGVGELFATTTFQTNFFPLLTHLNFTFFTMV